MKSATASVVLLTAVATTAVSLAGPSGGDFEIINSSMDNGGGRSSGGNFTLTGTIGQPDASEMVSSGGDFQLAGGFWARITDLIFKDGLESG